MPIPQTLIPQRDFSAGQIDESLTRRDDTDLYKAALKLAQNTEPTAGGGFRQRAGTELLFTETSEVRVAFHVRLPDGNTHIITLGTGRFTAKLSDGTLKSNITGCPWSGSALSFIVWELVDYRLIITTNLKSANFQPQVFTYSPSAGTWSRAAFAFPTGLTGALRQPYYRFAGTEGISLSPSGFTGSITVTASAGLFNASHVGVDFLYGGIPGRALGRAFRVTGYTNPTTVTATVLEELPPTQAVVPASGETTTGFQVGQVVEGDTSGTVGVVTAVASGQLDVTLAVNYQGFTTGEQIISPTARFTVGSWTFDPAPATSLTWSEALISAFRGWPGSVSSANQRVIFTDLPQLPQAVCWSAIGTHDDFLVTGDETGAIVETIPDAVRCYHVLGGYDQFAFTDVGIYYIPVSGSSPLISGSVEFRRIESEGSSFVRPQEIEGSHIFVNSGRSSIMAIQPTGQTARPYIVRDISRYHRSLINSPICLAVLNSRSQSAERYIYVVNGGGAIALGQYEPSRDWIGWRPHITQGSAFRYAHGLLGALIFTVERTIDGTTLRWIEQRDPDLVIDGATYTIAPLGAFLDYAGGNVEVIDDASTPRYYGNFPVNGIGTLVGLPSGLTTFWAGFEIACSVIFLVPGVEGGQSVGQRQRRRRIARSALTVKDTQGGYTFHGKLEPAFRAGESQEAAAPLRDETIRRRKLGRSFSPEVDLTREMPGLLEVLEVSMDAGV